ncbi:hypothetical protein CXQ85_000392 [Candidozyma haemuli]|uniref:Mitochondrial carrier n=1 Tax=Candidozyma haemuli TaxID=45357 RepID=A0A2V1AUB6_9ASCO|nr:hypothetical protein CXQ85_000392 [[Candida] haemuloni]PVH21415.1 hypothetical protein CXQ85_000392 [[Candida] haemuloni]
MSVDESLSRKVKDIAAGFVGGATQVLIGQPFDLVKIRLQTSPSGATTTSIVKQVIQKEGPLAFYKGTLALFSVWEHLLKYSGKSELSLWPQTYLAGAAAGLVNSPVTAPVEQLRILSQASTKSTSLQETVRAIWGNQGVRGLYRGLGVTVVRECQAYGVWFMSYEWLLQTVIQSRGYKGREDVSTPELLACGAAAGNALWLSSYPLDVIKSNVQSDKFGPESRFQGSALKAAREIWATAGARGFWKGLGPCLVRAVPCSAGTFAAVETALRVLG